MQSMVLDSFACQFWICFSQQLVIDSNAVIGQSFPVTVVDTLAHLQKLQVVINCLFVLFYVVVQHSNRIVGSTLVSHLSCPPTPKSKHLIILQSTHHCHQSPVVDLLLLRLLLAWCSAQERTFLHDPRRSVEKQRQLDAVRLRRRHRPVITLPVELLHLVFFGKGAPYAKRSIDWRNVTAMASFSALHNKNITLTHPIKLFGFRSMG